MKGNFPTALMPILLVISPGMAIDVLVTEFVIVLVTAIVLVTVIVVVAMLVRFMNGKVVGAMVADGIVIDGITALIKLGNEIALGRAEHAGVESNFVE